MGHPNVITNGSQGLTVAAYCGSGAAMLAFNLDEAKAENLAGFSIRRTSPDGKSMYLPNRLGFRSGVNASTTAEDRVWHPSNEAPFQKFRWVDFPPRIAPGEYRYEVAATYLRNGTLETGPSAEVSLELLPSAKGHFEAGFTRGYLSSQAYAVEFKNAPIRPMPKSLDYDTGPYQQQYEWLGFHARKMVFDFLNECANDPSVTVDLFAYDLDEPDFLRGLQRLGRRLRAVLDNAPLHTGKALEVKAAALLKKSAGAQNIVQGHFHRFSHDKILIQKKDGKPVKVLTGSANFSVRGLYVQANSVLVFDDPKTAELYENAFSESFTNMPHFAASAIAKNWFDQEGPGLPKFSVCYSPHTTAAVSLDRVAEAIGQARSSVLFAVMELGGGGQVLTALRTMAAKGKVFSYGITQHESGDVEVYKPGQQKGILTEFSYLKNNVPAPFRKEYDGGPGQVIHHKFVVVDFNDAQPSVFAGSSNLADGGEKANGDNLLAITDASVAAAYAVEAIRLVDHYHFRAAMKSTGAEELKLDTSGGWAKPYYDERNIKYTERLVFAGTGSKSAARAS